MAPSIGDNNRSASFTLTLPNGWIGKNLKLRVMDGIADDAFDVYVGGSLVYTCASYPNTTGYWITYMPIECVCRNPRAKDKGAINVFTYL